MLHGMLLLCLSFMTQDRPTDREVNDVLRKVKESVAEEKQVEERQALLLVQQAEAERREGRMKDAAVSARKALRKFPESLPLRRLVRRLEEEEAVVKRQETNLRTARQRLDEALDAAEKLYRHGDTQLARELADAVLTAAEKFPVGVEVLKPVIRAETFLKQPAKEGQAKEPPAEKLPVEPEAGLPAPPPGPPPVLNVPSRKLLSKPITVDWQQVTLMEALQQVSAATGVLLRIDPFLMRIRVFESRRVTWQARHQPAERLLRIIMAQLGTDYLNMDNGQIYITTKQEAMTMILERRTPPASFPHAPPPRRPTSSSPEKLPDPEPETPAYLLSGKAFLAHIEELLKPMPLPDDGKP